MNKAEAIKLRDEIKAAGVYCVISRETGLPRIGADIGDVHFTIRAQWENYRKMREEQKAWRESQYRGIRPPKNAIEAMIDKACGLL